MLQIVEYFHVKIYIIIISIYALMVGGVVMYSKQFRMISYETFFFFISLQSTMILIDDDITVKTHIFIFGQQADGLSIFGVIVQFIKI